MVSRNLGVSPSLSFQVQGTRGKCIYALAVTQHGVGLLGALRPGFSFHTLGGMSQKYPPKPPLIQASWLVVSLDPTGSVSTFP